MNDTLPSPGASELIFTAARIAAALRISKRAVLATLKGVKPASQKATPGGLADAWSLGQLPARYTEQLAAVARQAGHRDSLALLADPGQPWAPPVPLGQLAQRCVDEAVKLRDALAGSLKRLNDVSVPVQEFERVGVEEYRAVFGHRISPRHFRRLLDRTVERDRGEENWTRLEIYLPERLARKDLETGPARPSDAEFKALSDILATFANPASPTIEEEGCLLLRAFDLVETAQQGGQEGRACKRAVIEYLQRQAPFLAPTPGALRRDFNRKFARWATGRDVEAVLDGRAKANRQRRIELGQADRDAVVAYSTLLHDGAKAPAIRRAVKERALSEPLVNRLTEHPGAVRSIVRAVGPEVGALRNIHRGPRTHRLQGADVQRDWSGVSAGDWFTSDDCTLPVYYWIADGRGWFSLTRGQFLPLMDLRSKRILDFVLLDSKSYSAASIRTLLNKGCSRFGLPRRGFAFERGIWESSRLLKGVGPGAATWSEVETGLRGLGLEFQHAVQAKAKPIENVLGLLQNRMMGEPGYVGRNEQADKFERWQKAKLEVEAKRVHPADAGFYSAQRWFARLHEILDEYNAESQESKMTLGLSPDDAWQAYQKPDDPLIDLPVSCRYLLATHCRRARVTPNGIGIQFGKVPLVYRSEETARLIGQSVLVWFDPEFIEAVTVTDMNKENPFAAQRVALVPAMDATPEDLASAQVSVARQNKWAKARYSELAARFIPPRRATVVDAETAQLGEAMLAQRAEAVERIETEKRNRDRSARFAREIGLAPAAVRRDRIEPAHTRDLCDLLKLADSGDSDGGEQPTERQVHHEV